MKYLSVSQMREADRRCIEELGIPGSVLMDNAGQAVYREVSGGPDGEVCGKGNNGGDGFVVARLALAAGMDTRVVLACDRALVTGDAGTFMRAYESLGGKLRCARSEKEVGQSVRDLADCAVIVDALLGTGIRGEVSGAARAAIEAMPEVPIIAVDLPSGMNADTGAVRGACVKADTTVTFQFAKVGFKNKGAEPYLGRLVVADIGIPEVCGDDEAWARLRGDNGS